MTLSILALETDGYGAAGGIARYNRDFLEALAGCSSVRRITVVPRHGSEVGSVSDKIVQMHAETRRTAYTAGAIRLARSEGPFGMIVCGHLYMAPLAALIARALGIPMWLNLHGIEAWDRPGHLRRRAAEQASLVTAVSRYTRSRFLAWAAIHPSRVKVLPNTVDTRFVPGIAPEHLRARHGLQGRKILLTVSRLSAAERYKGHDRVITALPAVLRRHPEAVYMIAGEGDDRSRLEAMSAAVGVSDRVLFVGRIAHEELADYYRLADVFVMPSTGEGFGIVYLEAAACGTSVLGLASTGTVDALADGRLGSLVDERGLADAMINLLAGGKGDADARHAAVMATFSPSLFANHVAELLTKLTHGALAGLDETNTRTGHIAQAIQVHRGEHGSKRGHVADGRAA